MEPCRRGVPAEEAEGIQPSHCISARGLSNRAWPPTQGLEGLTHRGHTPGGDVRVECLVEPLEAFGRLLNRTDVCVTDAWRRRGGTDDRREPPPVGRTPIGPAG